MFQNMQKEILQENQADLNGDSGNVVRDYKHSYS